MQKYVVGVKLEFNATCMYSKRQLNKGDFVYEVFDGNKLFYISEEQCDKLKHKFEEEKYKTAKEKEYVMIVYLKAENKGILEKELKKLEVEYEIIE